MSAGAMDHDSRSSTSVFHHGIAHRRPDDQLSAIESRQGLSPLAILDQWNRTTVAYPRDRAIHALFEAHAANSPDAVALICDEGETSYATLNRRANQLARQFRQRGVLPGMIVGVLLPRGVNLVTTILAILKAGAAYLPLDTADPAARIETILADARVEFLVSTQRQRRRLSGGPCNVIEIDDAAQLVDVRDDQNLALKVTAESPCSVMVTSGSTGQPKCVSIPHRAVVRLVCGATYVDFSAQRTLLQLAPIGFDASAFELWGALAHGARLVLAPEGAPDPEVIASLIERHQVCTLWLTAGLFNAFVESCPRLFQRLSQLIVGGEALSPYYVRRADELLPAGARIINGYGPTEATTFTCCYDIPRPLPAEFTSIPIGRPIANTRVYVLDERMQPVGIGAPGELYIGGDGLANGYLHANELTAARFVSNPLPNALDPRLYRSGDRVAWRQDGNLEFLGRLDDQIKIRGHRVEPAEIECALRKCSGVRNCAVVLREQAPAAPQLVAYFVAAAETVPHDRDLRTQLRGLLPEYMLPATFVKLDSLPITANGKIDRARLQNLEPAIEAPARETTGLRTTAEKSMATLWADVLGIGGVGGQDHFFFDLAGNSLLAIQLIERINRRYGVRLSMQDLLTTPTVVTLCAKITARTKPAPAAASYLTVVRQGKGDAPVVCVGFAGLLPALQAALPADTPIWWLKVDGLHAPPFAIRSIPEIAAGYHEELLSARPKRVMLVGHSFCGTIAFELARRLRCSHRVADAVLIEPSLPEMLEPDHVGMPVTTCELFDQEPAATHHSSRLRSWRKRDGFARSAADWTKTRISRRMRRLIRPVLKAMIGLGLELPQRYREWWFFSPDFMRRLREFEVNRACGSFVLTGQEDYLRTYAASWQALIDGKLTLCSLPLAARHTDVLTQPAADGWLAVIRCWIESTDSAESFAK